MSLNSEYKFEKLIKEKKYFQIYKGNHPHYGKVRIYVVNSNLISTNEINKARTELFNYGRQLIKHMRLNIPHALKVFEFSSDLEDPYVVTEFLPYDIEDLIKEKITLKPAQVFKIFKYVLDALLCLYENDLIVEEIEPHQISMSSQAGCDIRICFPTRSITAGETESLQRTETIKQTISYDKQTQPLKDHHPPISSSIRQTVKIASRIFFPTRSITAGETETLQRTETIKQTISYDKQTQPLKDHHPPISSHIRQIAKIAYELITGIEYEKNSNYWPKTISKKYHQILKEALDASYQINYSDFQHVLTRAISFNYRLIIIYAMYLLLLSLSILCYYGYNEYIRWKIKHSDSALAVEIFFKSLKNIQPVSPNIKVPEKLDPFLFITDEENEIYKPFLEIEDYKGLE